MKTTATTHACARWLICIALALCACKKDESGNFRKDAAEPNPEDLARIRQILASAGASQEAIEKTGVGTMTDAEREAYAIFNDFWDPGRLSRYDSRGWGLADYSDVGYLLVQQNLTVATRIDGMWGADDCVPTRNEGLREQEWRVQTVEGFAPRVRMTGVRILYLTPSLLQQIEDFLENSFTEAGTPDIMSTAKAEGRSLERLRAARTEIQVFPKHWGDGWHIASHPEIERILFSPDHRQAIVQFRIGYKGGTATYEKRSDGWMMTGSQRKWKE